METIFFVEVIFEVFIYYFVKDVEFWSMTIEFEFVVYFILIGSYITSLYVIKGFGEDIF